MLSADTPVAQLLRISSHRIIRFSPTESPVPGGTRMLLAVDIDLRQPGAERLTSTITQAVVDKGFLPRVRRIAFNMRTQRRGNHVRFNLTAEEAHALDQNLPAVLSAESDAQMATAIAEVVGAERARSPH